MDVKTITMDLAGRELKITNGPISTYASGYAIVSLGDTVVMANATMSESGREGADFFPMSVDYEENMYAVGKISGSRFVKRSGRPSENAVLISRLIDRPIRPLFPKGTTNEVQIICTTLSADMEVNPATTAINAASMALMLSGAPFSGPIGAVRMGYVNDELVVNPTYEQVAEGKLDLVVVGTENAITMVEAAAKEVSEDVVLKALEMAHTHIKTICEFQHKFLEGMVIEKIEPLLAVQNEEAVKAVEETITADMLNTIKGTSKIAVKKIIHGLEDTVLAKYATQIEEGLFTKSDLQNSFNKAFEKNMRKNILEKGERIDGRETTQVRPINVVLDLLPRTHGSALFQRGETMALSITTLGGPGDSQVVDTMEEDTKKRYFHHYNFPPFSVGDVKMLRGPSRRDIGHGDLAERALIPVLPDEADFPYTIWVHSEIVRCNGSSSMASVCGSTLSMMAAGVPLKRPVSGVAMGLVMDKETGNYKILTDIQGLEDFAGDMDFKITGTTEGITAIQMDIKVKGLSTELMHEALEQAKQGRNFILQKMLEVLPEPRKTMSKFAPLIMSMQINPDLIKVVIGKGGEMINKIIKECNVEIDINDEGNVSITAPDQVQGQKAVEWINKLTYQPKVGDIFDGKVVRIMEFGAFVEISPGKDGLVHISKLDTKRVNKVTDVVNLGDVIKVKLVEVDDQGRYNLSRVAAMEELEKSHASDHKEEVKKTDVTETPEQPNRDDWKTRGEIVEGTSSVRKVNGN